MARPRKGGKPFQHGNIFGKGRPAGSRNKATIQLQALALLDGEGEAIISKAIEGAKAGEPAPLRLCLERLLARRREVPVKLNLPVDIKTAEGMSNTFSAIVAAIARGEISPAEAAQISKVLEVGRKAIETMELERRLTEVEAELRELKGGRNE
jgi:hypothetical protein